MQKLTRQDLYTLEDYAETRAAFRAKVLAHKQHRKLRLGPHATLYFEDRMTIHYQVQEMLRVERIFEAKAIQDELNAYNPLIPDGHNFKATFMLEYPDPVERKGALAQLRGIEHQVWLEIDDFERVWAIADEDLDRADDQKTSSVHFLRFELTPEMISALKEGARLGFGIDHEHYRQQVDVVPESLGTALMADLD
jgi:hypothetical protein